MQHTIIAVFAALLIGPGLVSQAEAKPDLGTKWVVTDNTWRGVWTRDMRANSNIFHGVFTHRRHGRFTSRLVVHQGLGNKFTITRTDTSGPTRGKRCTYRGRISRDGTRVSATSTCQWAKGPWPMTGRIIGKRYREFSNPMYPGSRTHRLDYRWAGKPVVRKSPGKDPAIRFCKSKGFRTAVFWDKDSSSRVYRTRFIGTGANCRRGNRCHGYRVIHCR